MEYQKMKVVELEALAKSLGVRGYSKKRKAVIIEMIKAAADSGAVSKPKPQFIPKSEDIQIFAKKEINKKRPVSAKKLDEESEIDPPEKGKPSDL